jgi:plasmid segregation protein ParM
MAVIRFNLGLDVGYGNTKGVWSTDAGPEHNVIIPSVAHEIRDLEDDRALSSAGQTDEVLVQVDGRHYVVGPSTAVYGRTLHDDYIHTPQYRALVAGALYMAFKDLGEVVEWVDALVVGLPVYSFGKFREGLAAEMGKGFEVPVPAKLRTAYGKDMVFVRAKAIKVMPQPVGAMTDWRGRLTVPPPEGDTVIVADPGYKTFDWFAMRGHVIIPDLSGAFDGGVSELLKDVSVAITREHPNARVDIQTVEDGLERGKLTLVGVGSIDFTEYRQTVRKGARIIAQRMAEMLQRSQQSNKVRVDHLILAGGGAQYFEDAMREVFAGVDFSVLPKPVLANARGFWKVATRMA